MEWTIEFPEYRFAKFEAMISNANRRLERAGVATRFEPRIERYERTVTRGGAIASDGTTMHGTKVREPWVRVTFDRLRLTIGDFTFVARLVPEENGYVVRTAPGQSLDGWQRPDIDDMHCDHCGTKRSRTRLYVVRDERTGSLLQLGHSCIELYTGLAPKGLWALDFETQLRNFACDDDGFDITGRGIKVPMRLVLAYAYVFTDGGRQYRNSAEYAYESTGNTVREAMLHGFKQPSPSSRKAYSQWLSFEAKLAEASRMWLDGSPIIDEIIAAADTLTPGTDYAENMRVLVSAEYVSPTNIGMLASLVKVYAKVKEEKAKAVESAEGYIGDVGARIKDEIKLTLQTVRFWENDYGTTTLLVGYTDDRHCVVWRKSGRLDVKPGDVLVLGAATVKAHEQYRGVDQTVITRATIKHVEHADGSLVGA